MEKKGTEMKREDVYALIDGERKYQDTDPHGEGIDDAVQPVDAWVIFIEMQLNEAKNAIYGLDRVKALENIRKITALGVARMENNETPAR